MKISDLMTPDVLTVTPDTSLKEGARRMLEAGVSGLPVVDDEGQLVGIITEADFVSAEADRRAERRAGLLRWFSDRADFPSHEKKIGDSMTTEVVVTSPDADHAEAARLMEKEGVKRLPVVENGQLVGLVSRADMLKAFVRSDEEIIEEIRDHVMRRVLWIDPERISVQSVDGNVVLQGELETRSDVTLLVELTKRLDGVASVDDRLKWEIDNTKVEMAAPPVGFPRASRGLRRP